MGTIYLTSSPTPQCRLGCLLICGKCREMRRSEAEGRFGEAEPEGCASIRAFRRVACCASALSSHAAPWGHFASLVRSAPPARLPSASLRRISQQSRDCLRVRVLHSCTPSSRRQPCFPAFPAVARGALSLRRIYPRLLKCRKMRSALAYAHRLAWSGIPHPTPIGAPSRRITHPVT